MKDLSAVKKGKEKNVSGEEEHKERRRGQCGISGSTQLRNRIDVLKVFSNLKNGIEKEHVF